MLETPWVYHCLSLQVFHGILAPSSRSDDLIHVAKYTFTSFSNPPSHIQWVKSGFRTQDAAVLFQLRHGITNGVTGNERHSDTLPYAEQALTTRQFHNLPFHWHLFSCSSTPRRVRCMVGKSLITSTMLS
jgi:hypothetical protein